MKNHLKNTIPGLLVAALAACAQLPPRPDLREQLAIHAGETTRLDQLTSQLEAAHPAESAFRLVSEGTEAFVTRIQMARLAERSLDVQSYIWHSDLTGAYFAQELLLAADRGVKVRVLLDDMDARKRNDAIAALAAHPGIEVRTFNPYASRKGTFSFLTESLFNFSRINRRMHNKSWIADNRLAIAGGRNVGDEYFGANEDVNFVDLDFAMIGPVVRDVSASFDRYWNSASAYPMELLDGKRVTSEALQKLRTYLDTHAAAAEGARYRDAPACRPGRPPDAGRGVAHALGIELPLRCRRSGQDHDEEGRSAGHAGGCRAAADDAGDAAAAQRDFALLRAWQGWNGLSQRHRADWQGGRRSHQLAGRQ